MKLLLLGSTGRTGAELVARATAHGHDVTAFVRSPEKLRGSGHLSVVAGNPLDVDTLSEAMRGHDAIISTLGLRGWEALRPSTLMGAFGRATVQAIAQAKVPRLVVLSAGVLFPPRSVAERFAGWILRNHAHDLRMMEEVIMQSSVDWTIVRPPRLISGDDDRYAARAGSLPPGGTSLSFRAVAACMLDQVERGSHVREVVGLAAP